MEPKYPNIKVKLVGFDGNALTILGKVKQALKNNGVPKEEIDKWWKEATSGDYNKLLSVCMDWVTVE